MIKLFDSGAFPQALKRGMLLLAFSTSLVVYAGQTMKGKIVDNNGKPVIGATIIVDGETSGITSDQEGKFMLNVDPGKTLTISYIGYKTIRIPAQFNDLRQVTLTEDILLLDQVVVISYGSSTKKELVGSVSSVNVNDINSIPNTRIESALQGKVAGVMVTQSNGEPGAGMNISVRGIGTVGDSDPLYVIDGFPTKTGLNTINPNDIESISILKDASAAAMYGSRAANGVVLIKTKSGKQDRFTMDFDAYYGVQENLKKFDMLNASEWAKIRNQATLNDNPSGTAPWGNTNLGAGTDWQKEITQNATIQNYNLGLTGGTEKSRYALSFNHFDQEGIIRYSEYGRNSIRANIDVTPTSWINIGSNNSYSRVKKSGVDVEVNGVLKNAILAVPTMKVYNEDGTFAGPNSLLEGNARNPVSMAANSCINNATHRFTDNTYAEFKPFNNLTFRSSIGLDFIAEQNRDFDPKYSEGDTENTVASLNQNTNLQYDWIWENVLNYKYNIKNHKFKLLAGFSMEEDVKDWEDITKSNYVANYEYLQFLSNGSVADASNIKGSREEWSMISYFGRMDYNYTNKYLASASVRVDGSSRFAPGKRYATFPSFALGWRLSEEEFAKNLNWLNNMKIKASWGQLGNQDIGLYAYRGTMSQYNYNINGSAVVGYAPGAAFNENISWETTTQWDLGLESSMFNDNLTLEIDYYNKETDDMLVKLPATITSGFSSAAYVNAGSIRNSGFEFALGHAKHIGGFRYSLNANFTTVKNTVLSLGGQEQPIDDQVFIDYTVRTQKGQPMRQMYGYTMEGIYQNDQEIKEHLYNTESPSFKPGDVRYADLNKNGKFDPGDRTTIGKTIPTFFYGFSGSASYKGIDISFQLQGVGGNKIYNGAKWWGENTGETHNYSKTVLNSWHGENTSNSMPRLTLGSTQNNLCSTRYIEKGDYLRMKNLQIGYTLPENIAKKLKARSLRAYLSAQNLFTITGYTGFSPEVGTSRSDVRSSFGLDEVTYPQARTFTIGVNLGIF